MSSIDSLFVGRSNGKLTDVFIGKLAGSRLYAYLHQPLSAYVGGDYADEMEANHTCGILSFTGLDADCFRFAINLTLNACNEIDSLKPHKAALAAALEADERFRQPLTA